MNQEELFEAWKQLGANIDSCKEIFQNDWNEYPILIEQIEEWLKISKKLHVEFILLRDKSIVAFDKQFHKIS